jgi:predicted ATPase
MIIQLDVFNFKAHRAVRIPLSNYQLLVGPNGSGKSTVFDAILFVHNALVNGLESALGATGAESLQELTHCGHGGPVGFSFAFQRENWPILRYTTTYRQDESEGVVMDSEAVTLLRTGSDVNVPGTVPGTQLGFDLFRDTEEGGQVDMLRKHATVRTPNWQRILYKTSTGADTYLRVGTQQFESDAYQVQTQLSGPKQFTLKYTPPTAGFEFANWIKQTLMTAPSRIQLDITAIRQSGALGKSGQSLSDDGDNFTNVVHQFRNSDAFGFARWLEHVREYFSEIREIVTEARPVDKRQVVYIRTIDNTKIPQYLLSDGTLRFLALTLLAHRQSTPKLLLIEEPENGLHPSAIEGVLSPFKEIDPERQVIFASHSPVVLANFKLRDVIVFKKANFGTELVRGDTHPVLEKWVGDIDESELLAAGIF